MTELLLNKVLPWSVSALLASIPAAVASVGGASPTLLTSEGWLQVALQGAMTFVFALFLLWVWPQQNKFLREMAKDMQSAISENNKANAAVVDRVTKAFESHDSGWRELMSQRGYCPTRDGRVAPPQGEGDKK